MNRRKYIKKWIALISILSGFECVESQNLENMSNVGNIVLEQDPRQQDPFYRNFYARAEGMPLAAVNSVVHNVKHQSEGQFKLWHELPSHKVRPGYSTTTKAPKIRTTTVPWVRGRHRPQLGLQQVSWNQKFSDPDGYDTGQHGSDYDEGTAPAPRQRGRRPTGGRGRRPPPPMAPVRVQIGKEDGLVDNGEGEGLDLATLDEGTRAGDSEGTKNTEGAKVTTTGKTATTKVAPNTTKKPEKKTEKEKRKEEENTDDEDSEGIKKTDEEGEGEGEKHGEIDLADLKNGGVIHHLRTSGKGKTVGDVEDEGEEEGEEKPKKKEVKKGKKKEDDEEDEDDKKSKKSKTKEKGKKKGKKEEDDNEKESKNKKKGGKKSKKEDEDEDEEDDDTNGELKKVDGDVKIPKAVDGDTDDHDDDDGEDEEEDGEDEEDEDGSSNKKRNHKKGKKGKKHHVKQEEEEYEDEDDEQDDEEEEGEAEEEEHPSNHQKQKKMKKNKPSCPPAPQRHQNQPHHNPTHQTIHYHQNQNVPPNQVPYPNRDSYGYTHPTLPTTTTPQFSRERMGDDYHEFETMDCKENSEDDEENEGEEEDQSEEHKNKIKKKKSKKNHKKKGKKKSKKGGKKGHASLDYLTSREKIDQNKRNRGHILDELHADEDLKKIRKNSKPPESGVDCSTAVDEFPLKCGAWKSAGFCDTNQATQFLWCRKTCLCSTTVTSTTSSTDK